MPGAPGLIQGRQQFGVVDPKTGDQVGTFDALVSRVTASATPNSWSHRLLGRTAVPPTAVPPAGSLISNLQFGPIGISHSALPTPTGNALSLKITTPFGDIRCASPSTTPRGSPTTPWTTDPCDSATAAASLPTGSRRRNLIGTKRNHAGFHDRAGHGTSASTIPTVVPWVASRGLHHHGRSLLLHPGGHGDGQ